jgi:tetratricopeptide (TPR) repeat protein
VTSAEANLREGDESGEAPSRASRFSWPTLALWIGGLLLALAGAGILWSERGLGEARLRAKHGLWSEVHAPVDRYLRIHPGSAEANLLCAEAFVKDDGLPLNERIGGAVAHLQAIPDEAPQAVEARLAEARVHLFLNYSPAVAELAMRRALKLDPEDGDANYLMWKLLDLTRRNEEVEPYFWKVLAARPEGQRALVLRDWYLSQFYPLTATSELDRMMAFRISPVDDATIVESNRLLRFRGSDPDSPLCNAAMARWFRTQGDLPFALELLDKTPPAESSDGLWEPFFRGTLLDVLLDMGDIDRAGEEFDRWPAGDRGRDYLLSRGRVLQDARDDPAGAAAAYTESLAAWPGPIDWRTMNRAANCLARAGDQEGATAMRTRAEALEALMDDKVHDRLRIVLGQLDNPAVLGEVVDFYRNIGRPQEAEAWSRYIGFLGRQPGDDEGAADAPPAVGG